MRNGKSFLDKRTLLTSGKTTYTHRRQRTARRFIKGSIPMRSIYIYKISNTTNLLEGFNSQLKRALDNHNGLNGTNKKKFIDGFINTNSRLE